MNLDDDIVLPDRNAGLLALETIPRGCARNKQRGHLALAVMVGETFS